MEAAEQLGATGGRGADRDMGQSLGVARVCALGEAAGKDGLAATRHATPFVSVGQLSLARFSLFSFPQESKAARLKPVLRHLFSPLRIRSFCDKIRGYQIVKVSLARFWARISAGKASGKLPLSVS